MRQMITPEGTSMDKAYYSSGKQNDFKYNFRIENVKQYLAGKG